MDDALPELRDGFLFRGGHAALDLAATLAGRLKEEQTERLATAADVGRWLKAAGLARTALRTEEADLDAARRLREAVYAVATARIAGEAPPAVARVALNRMAAGEAASPKLDEDGGMHLSGPARALLGTLAREAVLLLGGTDAARIKKCEGETCATLFLDTSRAGDRRWCSMQACGNKAKVAEFRRRKRGGS
jgi:predicted RNA-binding Zn ribbon-like protein